MLWSGLVSWVGASHRDNLIALFPLRQKCLTEITMNETDLWRWPTYFGRTCHDRNRTKTGQLGYIFFFFEQSGRAFVVVEQNCGTLEFCVFLS